MNTATKLASATLLAFGILAFAPAAMAADVPDLPVAAKPADQPVSAKSEGCTTVDGTKCFVDLHTGIHMAYVEVGPADGKPLILLHGLTDTARSWAPAMAALHAADPSLHIFALDQRGHGGSSMPSNAACMASPKACFAPALFAADVVSFMNEKGIAKTTLAGHSMGSIVAQVTALNRPERIEKIILLATTNSSKDNPVISEYVLKEPVMGAWKKALDAKGITNPEAVWNATPRDADPKADDWILKNWDVDPVADQAFVGSIVPDTAVTKMGTWIGATSALLEFDNTAALAKLTTPTLVLWGGQDAIFYFQPDQTGMLAALRTSKAPFVWKQYGTKLLPKSGFQENEIGHNVQWDAPQQVAGDIISFMNTGKPSADAYHADMTDGTVKIVTDAGKAVLITGN